MNTGSYRFPLGGFDVISISDGAFNYPLEAFFANVPREEVEEVLRRHNFPPTASPPRTPACSSTRGSTGC